MTNIKKIMEKLEEDPSLVNQDDYDEIREISSNIVDFLDRNPQIDRKSFMTGFTVANVNAMMEILGSTTDELRINSDFISSKEDTEESEETEPIMCKDDGSDKGEKIAWPLRGAEQRTNKVDDHENYRI